MQPKQVFFGHYEPTGTSFIAEKHSLEAFLTERYCLYSADKQGNLYRGEIHHQAWPLQEARVSLDLNNMTEQLGFPLPDSQPITHFAKSLDVIAWLPGKL